MAFFNTFLLDHFPISVWIFLGLFTFFACAVAGSSGTARAEKSTSVRGGAVDGWQPGKLRRAVAYRALYLGRGTCRADRLGAGGRRVAAALRSAGAISRTRLFQVSLRMRFTLSEGRRILIAALVAQEVCRPSRTRNVEIVCLAPCQGVDKGS